MRQRTAPARQRTPQPAAPQGAETSRRCRACSRHPSPPAATRAAAQRCTQRRHAGRRLRRSRRPTRCSRLRDVGCHERQGCRARVRDCHSRSAAGRSGARAAPTRAARRGAWPRRERAHLRGRNPGAYGTATAPFWQAWAAAQTTPARPMQAATASLRHARAQAAAARGALAWQRAAPRRAPPLRVRQARKPRSSPRARSQAQGDHRRRAAPLHALERSAAPADGLSRSAPMDSDLRWWCPRAACPVSAPFGAHQRAPVLSAVLRSHVVQRGRGARARHR